MAEKQNTPATSQTAEKWRVITLSGEAGSGKSSIAAELIRRLPGWERVNTGQRFRDFCQDRDLAIEQVATLDPQVDRDFDANQRRLMETSQGLVLEGRLAGWLARDLPGVYRVYCTAPEEVRVLRAAGREDLSANQTRANLRHRDQEDLEKFRRIYQVADYRDPDFYHLVLDTSLARPARLAEQVLEAAGLLEPAPPEGSPPTGEA